jgi:hypothetical protein
VTTAGPLTRPLQVLAREMASKRDTVVRTDAAGRFVFEGMEPGTYSLSVGAFENAAFAQVPMRVPQDQMSRSSVEVIVATGASPPPVTLQVVPAAPLSVEVLADAASAAHSVWSWAQELQFTVTNESGEGAYTGGPSGVGTASARLELQLPEGSYVVKVCRRGAVVGERVMSAGDSWRLETR